MRIKPNTQRILYRYLPWLIGAVAVALCVILPLYVEAINNRSYWSGIAVALVLAWCLYMIRRIDYYHYNTSEESFLLSLFVGASSYLLPTVLFVLPIGWIVLVGRTEDKLRTITAAFLGLLAIVALAAVMVYLGWIECVWASFFEPDYQWGWIPVGIGVVAWIAITIVRQTLRVR